MSDVSFKTRAYQLLWLLLFEKEFCVQLFDIICSLFYQQQHRKNKNHFTLCFICRFLYSMWAFLFTIYAHLLLFHCSIVRRTTLKQVIIVCIQNMSKCSKNNANPYQALASRVYTKNRRRKKLNLKTNLKFQSFYA